MGVCEHQGTVGLSHLHKEAPWTSKYVILAFSHHSRTPVSTIEVLRGKSLGLRTARQCQPGTGTVIWPLSQGCRLLPKIPNKTAVPLSIPLGQVKNITSGEWGSIKPADTHSVFLVGYVPKGINKLRVQCRNELLCSGLTCLPGSQHEYWSINHSRAVLCRHHVVPRRAPFRISACQDIPVPLQWLGRMCFEQRSFPNGKKQVALSWCCQPAAPAWGLCWTGQTAFQIQWPDPAPQVLGGGSLSAATSTVLPTAAQAEGFQACQGATAAQAEGFQACQGATAAQAEGFQACQGATAAQAEGFQACHGVTAAQAEGFQACQGAAAAQAEGFQACHGATAAQAEGVQACQGATAAQAEGFQACQGAVAALPTAAQAKGFQACQGAVAALPTAAQAKGFQACQGAVAALPTAAQAKGFQACQGAVAAPSITAQADSLLNATEGSDSSHGFKHHPFTESPAQAFQGEASVVDVLAHPAAADPNLANLIYKRPAAASTHQPTGIVEDELHRASPLQHHQPKTIVELVIQQTNPLVSSQPLAQVCEVPGDPLYEWYSSPEMDWDECSFLVPYIAGSVLPCHCEELDDERVMFSLESVSWPSEISLSQALSDGLDQHRVLTQILETDDGQSHGDHCGDFCDLQKMGLAKLCQLEISNRHIQDVMEDVQVSLGVTKLPCLAKVHGIKASATDQSTLCPSVRALNPEEAEPLGTISQEEFLQTKTVPNEAVRLELAKWTPSIQAEYDSLTKESKAVHPITDEEFERLIRDPNIQCELVPGRAIFTVKAHTGRLKTRAVACGNHQTSAARSKEDKFASGISAEATRMLLRLAGMHNLKIGVLDIKTAFLNAPVVTPNQEVVIVRVPSIMRASGVCVEKYWVVDKALYGLDVAPRSWSLHRNKVLADITSLVESNRQVRCLPMEEDANIWVVVDCASDRIITYLALYVDDIMLVGERDLADEVARTLEGKWTTTPVSWVEGETSISFDGFEVESCADGYLVHQRSYVRELLKQYDDIEGLSNVPTPKEVHPEEHEGSRAELTKKAQCLTGQLLWLSGRTRPDIAFAVSAMGQSIVHDPTEVINRGHHLIRFLKQAPDVSLKYGPAPDLYGQWSQLKWKQTKGAIDVFSDASFMVDSDSRSIGSAQLFWGGSIVMWHCGRQPLLSASTAEAELIALADAFAMGRSLRPLIETLCEHRGETCRASLYTDNAAALQLCTLDAGSWRTRHLRLRGNMIRQATELGEWGVSHLEGVYMPADIGTKPVGPTRFEDLVSLLGLHCPHMEVRNQPPNPKVAALRTGVAKMLLALIILTQPTGGDASRISGLEFTDGDNPIVLGFALGFGGYFGWIIAKTLHHSLMECICPRRPTIGTHRVSHRATQSTVRGDSPLHTATLGQAQGIRVAQAESRLDSPPQTAASGQAQGIRVAQAESRLDSPPQTAASGQAQGIRLAQAESRLDSPPQTAASGQAQGIRLAQAESRLDSPPQTAASGQAQGIRLAQAESRLDLPPQTAASGQAQGIRLAQAESRLDSPPQTAASSQAQGTRLAQAKPRLDSPLHTAASGQAQGTRLAQAESRLDSPPQTTAPGQVQGGRSAQAKRRLDLPSHIAAQREPASARDAHQSAWSGELSEASEHSSVIDRVPHRLPDPAQDFEAYSRGIDQLTPEEYDSMFRIPIPGEYSETDSHANSNEQYVQTFAQEDSSDDGSQERNSNNTIGSRERAVEWAQDRALNHRRESTYSHVRGMEVYQEIDDEATPRESTSSTPMYLLNNAYVSAAGSGDQVIIPARRPTVLPPYPLRRIPTLEHQTEEQRIRIREMYPPPPVNPGPDEAAMDSNEDVSTDSGEYTVRDGSLPSSGNYDGAIHDHNRPRSEGSSRNPSVGSSSAIIATVVVASSITPTSGSTMVAVHPSPLWADRHDLSWTAIASCVAVLICTWWFGFLVAWMITWQQKNRDSRSNPSERTRTNDRVEAFLEQRSTHRRRRQGAPVFLTQRGECIHLSRDCPTLRSSRAILTRHVCTCCGPPLDDSPRNT